MFVPPLAVSASPDAWTHLGEAIRERRLELGLTQDELGISKAVASNLENGKQTSYARSTLRKVSKALGWPANRIEVLLLPRARPIGDDMPSIVELQVTLDRTAAQFDEMLPVLRALAQEDNPQLREALASVAEVSTEMLNRVAEVLQEIADHDHKESAVSYLAEIHLRERLAETLKGLQELRLPGIAPVDASEALQLLEAASSGEPADEDEPRTSRPVGVDEEPGPP